MVEDLELIAAATFAATFKEEWSGRIEYLPLGGIRGRFVDGRKKPARGPACRPGGLPHQIPACPTKKSSALDEIKMVAIEQQSQRLSAA